VVGKVAERHEEVLVELLENIRESDADIGALIDLLALANGVLFCYADKKDVLSVDFVFIPCEDAVRRALEGYVRDGREDGVCVVYIFQNNYDKVHAVLIRNPAVVGENIDGLVDKICKHINGGHPEI